MPAAFISPKCLDNRASICDDESMTNHQCSLANLADDSQLDDIIAYARDASTELIATATEYADDNRIAESISADELESASFTNLQCDPELMQLLMTAIIADRLNCAPDDICADY